MILHITTSKDWEIAKNRGEYNASLLKTEGFIHCSTKEQTLDTANLFFQGQDGLVLLCIDESKLTLICKFESPTGAGHNPNVGNIFPHVYGPINLTSVIKVLDFPVSMNGKFELPEELK